ncbi:hypothetical protein [Castellaniella sp. GW247-6E4]|uniref:hypothetical protein n=1 Tax=Castellaniella sp. GW247-6E4 TaxID=3140380 RepID=UPI0033152EDA
MSANTSQGNRTGPSRARAPLAALAGLALAASAFANPSFEARITIQSQCSIQPLFGKTAVQTTVVCQPGVTPYQSLAILLDGDEGQAPFATDAQAPGTLDPATLAPFQPRQAKAISPPFSNVTAQSKLLYVIF